ncbi:MAG: sterol desaturase family protein [Deltaproteobacteria bacterium]|nr:sterol desaturase family protein [Deltaproteobacteria bacterium]
MSHPVSNKNETIRLFKNPVLEYFSHIHPLVPVLIFTPIIAFFLYRGFVLFSLPFFLFAVLAGYLIWLLLEYALHRFGFHYKPSSDRGKRMIFLVHGIHHDYPRDSTRLVMPLLVSFPLAITFFFLFKALFGASYPPFFGGLVLGYLMYDCTHYASHHFQTKNRFLMAVKSHHLRHHYHDPESGFGLSNPLWDYVFGTNFKTSLPAQEDAALLTRESVNETT